MSVDNDPTQQIRVGRHRDDGSETEVLHLDDMFDGQPPARTDTGPDLEVTTTAPTEPVETVTPVTHVDLVAAEQSPPPAAAAPAPVTPVPAAPTAASPTAPPPPPPAPAAPAEQRIGAVPVAPPAQKTPKGPSLADRIRTDAGAAWRGGVSRSHTWLTTGDNAVIVATAIVLLALMLVVALV